MKFNFRKISAVAGSILMAGMTAGIAAAASFPAPFVQSGTADVAVAYGTGTGANTALDMSAATSIQTALAAAMPSTGSTVIDGESFKIEKTSTKFHLGDYVDNVSSSSVDEDNLPTLLAKGKYLDDSNDEFDYSQKLELDDATLQLKMFNDNDYAKDEPTIGFHLANNAFILNYTLDFTDKPYFNKLETTNLPLMGKEYYVLDVTSDNSTITLLDSADSLVLKEGDSETMIVDGVSYEVSVSFISSTPTVKLLINGETTNSLGVGQTQKLSDGAYVGIKEILYTAKDSGVSQVEFSIGSGKLKIENGQKVEMNDEDVNNVYGYVINDTNKLDDLVLKWTSYDETFITANETITMPGFETVTLSFTGLDFPTEEKIEVIAGGNDYVELRAFPLAGGTYDIPILGKASGNSNYTFVGSDTDELLVTSSGTTITFDGSSDSNDEMFVATYVSGADSESYLLRAVGFNDPSSGSDTVDIEYNDGSGWVKKYDDIDQGEEISFGNVELTLTTLTSTVGSESAVFTAGTNVNFDEIYSAEGLKVNLPWKNNTAYIATANYSSDSVACSTENGNFVGKYAYAYNLSYNVTSTAGAKDTFCYMKDSYQLVFTEENKDGDKGQGATFNITIGNNGASNYYSSVTDVNNYTSTREKDDTDVYNSWVYSALATKFVEDDSGDQDSVTIIYHGDEVTAGVYISSEDAVKTGGSSALGDVIIKDSEVSANAATNVIVVGGSCINSAAQTLLGGAYCGEDFTAATGVGMGQFLIKGYENGLGSKFALLVAGYEAADTVNAATYLTMKDVDTSKEYLGTSATEATLVTTSA